MQKTDNEIMEQIEEHLEEIMNLLEIERTPSNEGTPHRVAKMWTKELFSNRNNRNIKELDSKMKVFDNDYENEMVIMRDIDFNSMCEHHWLPFSGKVTVAYVPDKKVIGLSKIPRVVRYFSKKPTLQEKLGKEIGDYLWEVIKPTLLLVYVRSTHCCVKCRGAESDCETVSSYQLYKETSSKLRATEILQLKEDIERRIGI